MMKKMDNGDFSQQPVKLPEGYRRVSFRDQFENQSLTKKLPKKHNRIGRYVHSWIPMMHILFERAQHPSALLHWLVKCQDSNLEREQSA